MNDNIKKCGSVEVIRPPGGGFRSALFDFDGTISLLREGWQQVMVPYFVETLSNAAPGGDRREIIDTVTDFVDRLTGKQTIYQCAALADEIRRRGGVPEEPGAYKAEYLRRLMLRISGRHASIKNKTAEPAEFLVAGSVEFLILLKKAGIKAYLASGTDEADVLAEAGLLGIGGFFDGGIFGARDEIKGDAKEGVIRGILRDGKIGGESLVSFGDGFVEIQLTKEAGGYAVAVATDEKKRSGVDEWKRKRLLSAGADAVVADFSNAEGLAKFLKII